MLDRIATAAASLTRQNQLTRMQREMNRLTNEISSGAIENPASQLGSGASVLYRLHIDQDLQTALNTSITSAGQRLDTMQTALSSMTDITKEMAAATLNVSASMPGTGMNVLAAQARSALSQVTDLLNTEYDGHAIFAGSDSAGSPMADGSVIATQAQTILNTQAAAKPGGKLQLEDVAALLGGGTTTTTNLSADGKTTTLTTPGYGTVTITTNSDGTTTKTESDSVTHPSGGTNTTTVNSSGLVDFFNDNNVTIVKGGVASQSINYTVGSAGATTLAAQIVDASGNVVRTISISGTGFTAGATGTVSFDGTDGGTPSVALPAQNYRVALVDTSGATPQPAGTPALTSSFTGTAYVAGDDGKRSQVMIGATSTISYDVKANKSDFRSLMQGLSMLSLLDSDKLDNAAKKNLLEKAGSLLTGVQSQISVTAGVLGSTQQRLDRAATIQQSASNATVKQILQYEQADTYTDAQKLQTLQVQLQATYAITASLSKLSLVNYIS
ncbi:Flagellin (modular protein) (plasmid) [Rhodovastum atsumiense]|uniref:flagellin N-terminal helical domain-containing protein n=1 Tax=Rhodovastum atsumiense TaxID=504468 RepID=UPI0020250334|nr:flagellin [Rhodovastum atsumiense]CAH2605522.1 Flagellin (modular protein) [Rhodovastum atsumiense]